MTIRFSLEVGYRTQPWPVGHLRARADRPFRSWLEKYDLMEFIAPGRFYPTNRHAAAAFREEAP